MRYIHIDNEQSTAADAISCTRLKGKLDEPTNGQETEAKAMAGREKEREGEEECANRHSNAVPIVHRSCCVTNNGSAR